MKRVFTTSDQVIHLWANQSQIEARCSNVFFNGTSIYSYGNHYELGRLHNVKGQTIAVINSERYSVTTSKHQSQAYAATSHLPTLKSSDVSNIETGLLETQDKLINQLFDFFNSRSNYEITNDSYLVTEVKEYNRVCDALNKPKMKLEVDADFITLMNEHVKKCLARKEALNSPEELAKKAAKQLRSEELKKVKLSEQITSWKNGGTLTNGLRDLKPELIRVFNHEVQTTKGASVPFMQAKLLLTKIMNNSAKEGEQIGDFKLNRVQGELVTIGCHTISLDEAKEVLLKKVA